ncbi:hypothetical protein [Lewinella sp. W8]|uniref:hypothetical protein n=1 Tax=Lewinella sp. W8 TaxID=2528208 RepID=UPI0010675D66|nr:hypothetical protein [Lewinella sp. W8]MTB51918.1 hypothetical protein [Lewinella sp. W8]
MNFRIFLYTLLFFLTFSCDTEESFEPVSPTATPSSELKSANSQAILTSISGNNLLTGINTSNLTEVERVNFSGKQGGTKTYVSFSTGIQPNNEEEIVSVVLDGSTTSSVTRAKHDHTSDLVYIMAGDYGQVPVIEIDPVNGTTTVINAAPTGGIIQDILCIYNHTVLFHYANCERADSDIWYGDTWIPCYSVAAYVYAAAQAIDNCL